MRSRFHVENEAEVLELLLAHVLFAALDDVRLYVCADRPAGSRLDRLAIVAIGIHGGAAAERFAAIIVAVAGGGAVAAPARSDFLGSTGAHPRWRARLAALFRRRHGLARMRHRSPGTHRLGLAADRLSEHWPACRLLALCGLRGRSLGRHQWLLKTASAS